MARARQHRLGAVLALWVAMAPCALASAQSATISMTADRTSVGLGEAIRLQIRSSTSSTDVPEPTLPDLSAFQILSRGVSRPMQVQMTWGGQAPVVTASSVYTFVLQPTHEGTFRLEPATITVQGHTFRSNPLTLTVSGGGAAPPSTGGLPVDPTLPPSTGAAPAPPSTGIVNVGPSGAEAYTYDDTAFVRTVVDTPSPYVGQQVTVSIWLCVRRQLSNWPGTTQEPTTDGFWTRDLLPPARTPQPIAMQIQGVTFWAYEMRRFAAFPLREGDLTVGPLAVTVSMGNPFDIFLGGTPVELARSGQPIAIHARALPPGAPRGTVHVGTLGLDASLDRAQSATGDAVTLTVHARGTGRIDGLELPDLTVPGLRILAPHLETQIEAPGDRVGGTRQFEWLIVPEQPGTFTIPSFQIPVLDPVTSQYTMASTTPLTLTAAGNALVDPTQTATTTTPETPEADETASTPLGPVRTDAALTRHRTHLATQPWYPYALGVFPLAWVGLVVSRALRRRMSERAAQPSEAKVAREAKKRLATAEEKARAGDARGFYGALVLAISSVVEGKLGESVGALTHRELEKRLVARGMEGPLAKRIASELEGSDFARYSTSGAAPAEMDAALQRGREILDALDKFVATEEDD